MVLIAGVMLLSCGKKEREEATPAPAESQISQEAHKDSTSAEKYYFGIDRDFLGSLKQGDTFEIATRNQEMIYKLNVRRVQEAIPGITSISANVEDTNTGLATLLFRDGKLTGVLDIYKGGIKYRVQYDSSESTHFLQEILPEEMDALEGGTPLSPRKGMK